MGEIKGVTGDKIEWLEESAPVSKEVRDLLLPKVKNLEYEIKVFLGKKLYREMKKQARKQKTIAWRRMGFSASPYRRRNPHKIINVQVYAFNPDRIKYVYKEGFDGRKD